MKVKGKLTDFGVILLFFDVCNFGISKVPAITLASIIAQILLHINVFNVKWQLEDVCISAYTVLSTWNWRRFIISTFEHGTDMHLYYNMASYLVKGKTLEDKFGSRNFLLLLIAMIFYTNSTYVIIGQLLTELSGNCNYAKSCAIGFSGIIFALKVLASCENPNETVKVYGIVMPGKYAAWTELIIIYMISPNSSFIGHLAGILAGLIYCKTAAGKVTDTIICAITGCPMLHVQEQHKDYEYECILHKGDGDGCRME